MRLSDSGPGLPNLVCPIMAHDAKMNPVEAYQTALPRDDTATIILRSMASILHDPLIRLREKNKLNVSKTLMGRNI